MTTSTTSEPNPVTAHLEAWATQLKENHAGNRFKPDGMVEIDQYGLASTNFESYEPQVVKYAYVLIPDPSALPFIRTNKPEVLGGHVCIYFDGTGVFSARTYEDANCSRLKVRFWRFGCQHDYAEITREEAAKYGVTLYGPCDHATKCKKCGHVFAYNSGD